MQKLQPESRATIKRTILLISLSLTTIIICHQQHARGDQYFAGGVGSDDSTSTSSNKRQVSWLKWWSYDGISGPDFWSINKRWQLCGSGRRQSPIEISTERLVYDHHLTPLKFSWSEALEATGPGSSSEQQVKAQFVNSNRGIELWLNDSMNELMPQPGLILEGGPLAYAYKLYKIEFHFAASALINNNGQEPSQSSINYNPAPGRDEERVPESLKTSKRTEHLIDGRDFDGELQLHFYNRQHLSGAEEARRITEEAGDRSGEANLFAAISIFIQRFPQSTPFVPMGNFASISNSNQLDRSRNVDEFLVNLLNNLPREWDDSKQANGHFSAKKNQLESLITTNSEYITYEGSLNRPPCSENVNWIVLNRALRIGSALYDRIVGGGTGNANISQSNDLNHQQSQQLNDNVRPVKARHGRLLRTSINVASFAIDHHPLSSSSGRESQSNPATGIDLKDLSTSGNRSRQLALTGSCSIRPNYVYELKHE